MNRRSFLQRFLLAGSAAAPPALLANSAGAARRAAPPADAPGIIDTNINLFRWPYRTLKYAETPLLLEKLRRHNVVEGWAGSFDALLSKNVDAVNAALAEECARRGEGMLVPFGTVVPAWPDWEEDLRRCHEVYHMPGIRLYPSYQSYTVAHGNFVELLRQAAGRGLIVQVALGMEDSRVHHPSFINRPIDAAALAKAAAEVPQARVQVLHGAGDHLSPRDRNLLVERTKVFFDISRLEGNGILWQVLRGSGELSGDGKIPLDRLLFGSHAPYFPLETAVLKLFESPLELAEVKAIMQGNARRLLPRA